MIELFAAARFGYLFFFKSFEEKSSLGQAMERLYLVTKGFGRLNLIFQMKC
jgi:hypothetical protein